MNRVDEKIMTIINNLVLLLPQLGDMKHIYCIINAIIVTTSNLYASITRIDRASMKAELQEIEKFRSLIKV